MIEYRIKKIETARYTKWEEEETDKKSWRYVYPNGITVDRSMSFKRAGGQGGGWGGYVTVWQGEDDLIDSEVFARALGVKKAEAWRQSGEAYKRVMARIEARRKGSK